MEIKDLLEKVAEGYDLSMLEAEEAFSRIFLGEFTNAQMASFLTSLKIKGETVEEIAGAAGAMRKNALPVEIDDELRSNLVDTCGTGGDYKNTFNISTSAALIAAGSGVKIAKHGNAGVSSKSGSADVLKELGVNINAGIELIIQCIGEANIGFLFAPKFYGAMKFAAPVRKELGFKTIFNILGPLTNPFGAKNQLLGVYSLDLSEKVVNVLRMLKTRRAFVVHGKDGLDEVSLSSTTMVHELNNGIVTSYEFDPRDYGFELYDIREFQSFSPSENALIIEEILNGKHSSKANMAVINAGFVLLAAGKANDLKEAFYLSKESLSSGMAKKALNDLKKISNF